MPFVNPESDKLLDEAERTFDLGKQDAILAKVHELVVDEATALHVNLPATRVTGSLIENLKRVLLDHTGPKPVFLHLGEKILRLPDQFNVATDNGLFAELRVLLGPNGLLS